MKFQTSSQIKKQLEERSFTPSFDEAYDYSYRNIPTRQSLTQTHGNPEGVTAVYRAVNIIANLISTLPVQTMRGEEVIENPLIVNNPSLTWTRRDIYFQIVQSLATKGEAFLWVEETAEGRPVEIKVLHPDLVGVTQDETGQVWYHYNEKRYFPRTKIRHLRLYTRPGELRGYGPLQACAEDIENFLSLRNYSSGFYRAGLTPVGVLSAPTEITKEQAEIIRERWKALMSEKNIAVLGQGFNYQSVSVSPKEALMIEALDWNVLNIARLFGVPPSLMFIGVANVSMVYRNAEMEFDTFFTTTLSNYVKAIEDAMSGILPRGQRMMIKEDGAARADTNSRFDAYATAIQNGFMTVDEVRKSEGLHGQFNTPHDGAVN